MDRSVQHHNDPKPAKFKGGVFIVGDMKMPDGSTQLHVLAPWTEGNFSSDGTKSYLIPKGTIDKDEDVWAGAIREVREETGIDIERIYDPKNPDHKEKGRKKDVFYQGVKVLEKTEEPFFDHVVPTNRGNPAQHKMFMIKVKGIEKLKEHIKHYHNGSENTKVSTKATTIRKQKGLPDPSKLLKVLRTGKWHLSANPLDNGDLFEPSFPEFERNYFVHKIRKEKGELSLEDYQGIENGDKAHRITRMDQLDEAFQLAENKDKLKDDLSKIRKHMEVLGLLNDEDGLKLDTKQHPLRYFQESADIIPFDIYLQRTVNMAEKEKNYQYRHTSFGAWVNDTRALRRYEGQQHAIADIVVSAGEKAQELGCKDKDERLAFVEGTTITDCGRVITPWEALTKKTAELKARVLNEKGVAMGAAA